MKDQVIKLAQAHLCMWESLTSRPFTTREKDFATLVRNAALEEAAQKCRNNHQRFKSYTGTLRAHDEDIAAAIESLKEPTP